MSLEHLYEGRFAKERPTRTYRFGVYLSYEATIDAVDEAAAREAFEEDIREIRRASPDLEIADYY